MPLRLNLEGSIPDRISLKSRVIKAGAWTFAGYGLGQCARFGSNLLMTRLLMPSMFGVMAIATVIMIGLVLFSDLGISPNIVQSKRGADPVFLNTAWATQIFRGVLLWFLALIIAFLLAIADRAGVVPPPSVYADPRLPDVIGILSFNAVIYGFLSTKLFEASRNLALGRVTVIQLVSAILGLMCTLTWAYFDRSIWALVSGNISAALSLAILSHAWLPGTPNRWHWDKSAFWEIFHFGKWLFVASILAFFVSNSDRLLLGGMISTITLGIYTVAFMIVNSIEQIFSVIMSSVMFPALSEIARERPAILKEKYNQLQFVIAPFIYFCSGVLITFGPSLIRLLYDPRYVEAGWMIRILAVGLLTIPFQMAIHCFIALGRPQLNTHIIAVRVILLILAMPLGFHIFGLPGALWGGVCSRFLSLPIIIFYGARYKFFNARRELLLFPIVFVGAVTGEILTATIGYLFGI